MDMIRNAVLLSAVTVPLFIATSFSIAAVKSPAMASCSAEWAKPRQSSVYFEYTHSALSTRA